MTAATTRRAGPSKRKLPILEGILPFDRTRLPAELIAGATLAALAMPEVMGYSDIAGMPVYTGLYTLVLPMLAFAIFGSSRHLVVGADSATAAVLATGLAGIAAAGAPGSPQWVAMAGLSALMCAAFMIVARVIRLGFIANFLSHSVLIGFLTGVGIQVALGQFGGLFGVSEGSGTTLQKFGNALRSIADGQASLPTLAVSITVLAVIVGLGRVNKKIPGALIAVVGMIVASYVFDFVARGITTVGAVPSGLPPIGLPDIPAGEWLSLTASLLPIVFSMFVLILAQSAATSRAYAMKYDDSFDENVDLVGLGVGNLAAGLSGTFVVNGSPTKTEMVDGAGGRSQIAQVTTGLIVVVVLLFLTGALVLHAQRGPCRGGLPHRPQAHRLPGHVLDLPAPAPASSWSRFITAATVVLVGVEQGIILAIVLSLIVVLSARLPAPRPGHLLRAGRHARPRPGRPARHKRCPASPSTSSAPSCSTRTRVASRRRPWASSSRRTRPCKWLALDAAAIGDLDYSGADTVRQVADELERRMPGSCCAQSIRRSVHCSTVTG